MINSSSQKNLRALRYREIPTQPPLIPKYLLSAPSLSTHLSPPIANKTLEAHLERGLSMLPLNIFFDKLFFFGFCKHTGCKGDLYIILQYVLPKKGKNRAWIKAGRKQYFAHHSISPYSFSLLIAHWSLCKSLFVQSLCKIQKE